MTPINITFRIKSLESEIAVAQVEQTKMSASYNSWLTASKRACNQSLKKNREKCKSDRAADLNKAKSRLSSARSLSATVVRKTAELQTLRDTQKSNNQQAETLAEKGIVYAAEVIEAEGEATATQIKAASEAEALTSEADAAKNQKTIIVVVVSVVVLAIVFIYVKSKIS